MKAYLFLIMGLMAYMLFSQNDPVRREPVHLDVDRAQVENSERYNVVYPGCSNQPVNTLTSPCFVNMINRDLEAAILNENDQAACKDVVTTLELLFNESGQVELLNIDGENLDESTKSLITKAVAKLNSMEHEGNEKIKPAYVNGKAVSVQYSIPFVLKGKKYHLFDTFQADGKTYNVFRTCEVFYIKEENGLKTLDHIEGEANYNDYKAKMLNKDETDETSTAKKSDKKERKKMANN